MQKRYHRVGDAAFAFSCSFPCVLLHFLLLKGEHRLYEDGALEALFLDLTAELVRVADIPME